MLLNKSCSNKCYSNLPYANVTYVTTNQSIDLSKDVNKYYSRSREVLLLRYEILVILTYLSKLSTVIK
jgi:hypothetical protein